MKIIGRTDDRGFVTVISMEEMIKLMGASQTLNEIVVNQIPITHFTQYPEKPAEATTTPATAQQRHDAGQAAQSSLPPSPAVAKKKTRRARASAAPTKKPHDRHKTCAVCAKGFLDKSSSHRRVICEKIACKKEWKRRANVAYRTSHMGKPGKEIACLKASVVPANSSITDMKAQRLATIKAIAEKHKFDNAS
jgi:hypothetical protein